MPNKSVRGTTIIAVIPTIMFCNVSGKKTKKSAKPNGLIIAINNETIITPK